MSDENLKFKTLLLSIKDDQVGQRIDKVLPSLEEISSRSQSAKLLDQGRVTLNSKPVKASLITEAGQTFIISLPEPQTNIYKPYDFPLDVLHEDEDLIIINKPAGLVVHPALGHTNDTLVNALIHRGTKLSMGFNEERPGIVHRLDKGTSGVLVVAKNNTSHEKLAHQFQEKTVIRRYWGICWGHFNTQQGTIRTLISRHLKDRKKFASHPEKGKSAITHYKVLKDYQQRISLVECQLETGRTHQIRVHLTEEHRPIVGDKLYGNDRRGDGMAKDIIAAVKDLNRIALHAFELGFTHPSTNEELLFQAPFPKDLENLIALLDFSM